MWNASSPWSDTSYLSLTCKTVGSYDPYPRAQTFRSKTLQRWVAGYKREGLAGLVRKSRMESGERRTVTPRLCEAIEGLALEKPPLPLTSVHRQAKQFAHLVGEPAPSYWVVRDIVLSLPNDLRTLAQQGTRRFASAK